MVISYIMKLNILIASSIIFLILDAAFIYMSSNMFSSQIMQIQKTPLKINITSSIACYVFLIFGLYFFILREHKSVLSAFFLGIVIYGVYETTTFALLKNWHLHTVLIDTLWGGILFASTTYLTYSLMK
jgi:uncharacterized membrane protein